MCFVAILKLFNRKIKKIIKITTKIGIWWNARKIKKRYFYQAKKSYDKNKNKVSQLMNNT